jgi:ubiquinone/menaquinone biosynthesis C-methylase UbiE
MSAAPEQPEKKAESTYVIDAENAAEMARLMRQDQLLTSGMGGVFPEKIDLSEVQRVLDLACGPGGWPLEVAYAYADMEVVGVDVSERMIAYANAQAQAQQRTNASFRVMNILQPLDFPDASFDLVNARFISAFMRPEAWPKLIQECLRVLRPGGILRFTEFEWDGANKPSFEKICALASLTLHKAGYTFSPGGYYLGLFPVLLRLFREAGLQSIGKMAHVIDFSAGTEARDGFYYDFSSAFQLVTPFVVRMGIATEEEWRDLYRAGLAEMFEEDFCAMLFLLTVWGNKPA